MQRRWWLQQWRCRSFGVRTNHGAIRWISNRRWNNDGHLKVPSRSSEKHVSMISDSSFRSVRVEFQSHSFVDLVVQPDVLFKTDCCDTSADRKGTAETVPTRLAKDRRRAGRSHFRTTFGLPSPTSDWRTHSWFIARERGQCWWDEFDM